MEGYAKPSGSVLPSDEGRPMEDIEYILKYYEIPYHIRYSQLYVHDSIEIWSIHWGASEAEDGLLEYMFQDLSATRNLLSPSPS